MHQGNWQKNIQSMLASLRAGNAKKFFMAVLAAAVLLLCIIYLASGSCSSNAYGSFSRNDQGASAIANSTSSPGSANSSSLASATQFDALSGSALLDTVATRVVVVFVSGAVEVPGLYQLEAGKRIGDAIELAGGIRFDGAPDAINLATPLEDGQQIRVPTLAEAAQQPSQPAVQPAAQAGADNLSGVSPSTKSGVGLGQGAGGSQADGAAAVKININTADLSALQSLTGIGPATAQKIIDYRTAHGLFASIEDLKAVSGIGEKKYQAIASSICV